MRFWGGRTGRIQAIWLTFTLVFLIVAQIYFSLSFDAAEDNFSPNEVHSASHKLKEERYHIQVKLGGLGVATLFLKLKHSRDERHSGSYVHVGEHDAQVVIDDKMCIYPRFALRLFGDALVPFDLQQGLNEQKHIWNGKFIIPFAGKYILDARWFGCELSSKMNLTHGRICTLSICCTTQMSCRDIWRPFDCLTPKSRMTHAPQGVIATEQCSH